MNTQDKIAYDCKEVPTTEGIKYKPRVLVTYGDTRPGEMVTIRCSPLFDKPYEAYEFARNFMGTAAN